MKIDKKTQEIIQELQITEQNLQGASLQKQAFQIELSEIQASLEEIKNSKEDIYKITGQIMLKAKKEDITKELEEKSKILEFRLNSLIKQEQLLQKKSGELRKEVESKISNKKSS